MFKPGFNCIFLLMVFAGCATAPRQAKSPAAPDWDVVQITNPPAVEVEHVSEAPPIAPPPAAAPELFHPPVVPRVETWVPVDRWCRESGAATLRQIAWAPAPAYSLNTARGVLIFQVKSLVARWNGLEFFLGFEPQLIGGQPFMHALDLEKNLKPLLHGVESSAATNRVIVIDAGHGGKDNGTQGVLAGGHEKAFTLDWARRLARLLTTNGFQAFLTRTEDTDHSLSNRVAFAEEKKADLFVSLHFNSAAPDHEQSGLETYCLTPVGMPSTLTRGYEDLPSLVFPDNAFDEQNFLLAMNLHRTLVHETGMADRGVRRARFLGVLRGQNRPAVLIEGGYLSNPREARRIADPAYRQKLAQAVADALLDHLSKGAIAGTRLNETPVTNPAAALPVSTTNQPPGN